MALAWRRKSLKNAGLLYVCARPPSISQAACQWELFTCWIRFTFKCHVVHGWIYQWPKRDCFNPLVMPPFKKWNCLTLGPPSENYKCTFYISSQHPKWKLLHGGTGSLMILKTGMLWNRGTNWRSSPLDEHMGNFNEPCCGGTTADAWKKIGSWKHLYIQEMAHVHLYLFILLQHHVNIQRKKMLYRIQPHHIIGH